MILFLGLKGGGCLYYSVRGGLHSRFSYTSIEFHKYALCVKIVLNIRYGVLVESNHIVEHREMALVML